MGRLIEGQDYVIRCVPFPNSAVDGAIVSHPDISCVYINSRVSPKRQREALQHELDHLKNDDLYSDDPAVEIERRMP